MIFSAFKGRPVLVLLLLMGIVFIPAGGCKDHSEVVAADGEGTVVYKIAYPENNPYKTFRILPFETVLVFKGPKATFITSVLGLVQIINLLDNEKKVFTSLLLNTVGENYAFTDTPEEVKAQESSPQYKIEKTDEKKTIAGLECRKAVVNDLTNKTKFDIYYYEKVKVYLGNSPYKDFNYLLLDYRDVKQGLPVHLEAVSVDFNKIDTAMLSVQGEYTWVDRKTFISIVQNLKAPI